MADAGLSSRGCNFAYAHRPSARLAGGRTRPHRPGDAVVAGQRCRTAVKGMGTQELKYYLNNPPTWVRRSTSKREVPARWKGGLAALVAVLVDDGVDDVCGCRTGIASRIDLGELGQVIRVVRCSDECAGGVNARVHVVVRVASVVDGDDIVR